uniref:Uncharacterized protein n=1 Tax=Plectus sambesii TaxID=2011161 RepID=A0A914XLC3_9BILA
MYKGTDDAANLQEAFAKYIEELSALRLLPVPGIAEEVAIKLLLAGDKKFISNLLGHQGTLATYPCPFCLVERAALGSAAEWEYCRLYTTRTIEDYNCAAGRHNDAIPSHKQSQKTTSVS